MMLAGFNLSAAEIALVVEHPATGRPVTEATISKHFAHELKSGRAFTNSRVVESLYKKAVGNSPQAVTAAIWWTKARCGWSETQRIEHDGPTSAGVLVVPAMLSPNDWIADQQKKNADRKAPGGSE